MSHAPTAPALHCPECKSSRLSVLTESSVDSANAIRTPVTRRVGVTTYSVHQTTRNYWMCHTCGTKFRNIQNLKGEIARETKRKKACLICFAVLAILLLLLLITAPSASPLFIVPVLFLLGLPVLLFLLIGLSTKKKVDNLTKELEYLQYHCFN